MVAIAVLGMYLVSGADGREWVLRFHPLNSTLSLRPLDFHRNFETFAPYFAPSIGSKDFAYASRHPLENQCPQFGPGLFQQAIRYMQKQHLLFPANLRNIAYSAVQVIQVHLDPGA